MNTKQLTILYQASTNPRGTKRRVSVWVLDEKEGPTTVVLDHEFEFRTAKQRVREILLNRGWITKDENAPSGAQVWNDSNIRYFELE